MPSLGRALPLPDLVEVARAGHMQDGTLWWQRALRCTGRSRVPWPIAAAALAAVTTRWENAALTDRLISGDFGVAGGLRLVVSGARFASVGALRAGSVAGVGLWRGGLGGAGWFDRSARRGGWFATELS